ncbi:MAG: PAS domain S-box protein [Deltaproteobacteria bacterium]|nr:MAG: PAS domain S-box protein [Deltaproteobacteria bacterium]
MRSIQEAKEEWEATFDAIEDAIFLIDETFTIQRANKGLAKLVGKNLTDIIGQKCYKLLHDIDHVPKFCLRPLLVKTFSYQSNELWEPHLNRYLQINCYPIIGAKKEVREVIHVIRDITERQKTLQELEYLASVVRHSQDAIISTDLNCQITSWNKAAERIFGYDGKEAVGNYMDIIIPEEQRKKCQLFVEEIGEGGGIENYETTRKTKDGKSIDVDLTLSPIKESEGDIIGVSFIARDVTYQKQLEAKLIQAQKMESIGTLAGGIAHDFNNLLMGIQGYASLMLLKTDPLHPHYEMLRKIEEQVQSASDLTKQLLGFARGGRYETKPTNFNELIHRSSEMFGRTKKEIVIHSKLEKDLWTVEVDQGQMEQVLLNLYVNAWHAMPGGGNLYLETSNVTLNESYVKPYDLEAGNYIKISVTDTGIGMDKKTKQRIFDPFFTTKEMGRGTGLGLASVYGIITNHKGIITVYSEKDYGTKFNIYLPVCEKAITPPTRIVSDKILKGAETILLVDDEEQVIDTTKQMLEYMGYMVLSARGGKEALVLYQDNRDRIDLVILDLIMPGTNGGEVYNQMKALNPDVRVILSSGYSLNDEASEVFKRGANAFIQKPFSIVELSYKIREVIDGISLSPMHM